MYILNYNSEKMKSQSNWIYLEKSVFVDTHNKTEIQWVLSIRGLKAHIGELY